mgnify:CR=1 FL=1|tara:strand:+ start:78105 stop:78881 length:777 start_codon:yes stop_codon:yes gene_type:complete
MNTPKLNKKIAIITGGAGGIGKATAKEFIENGAEVLIVDLNENSLSTVCKEIGSNRISYFVGDVSSPESNESAVNEAIQRYGGLDIFVANAGIEGEVAPIESYSLEAFDDVIKVNLKGPFLGLKASIEEMKKRGGGSFIITSSIAGVSGAPKLAPYVASKHAVVGLMKSAAKELAEYGIRVNTINPSPVETRMMEAIETGIKNNNGKESDPRALMEATVPMGRYAYPEEIAKLMLFLASDDSSFITGSVYLADGGSTA